jgi:hypothetical protein
MLANDPDGDAPNVRPEAGNLPSDDDGLKRSQSDRFSPAPLEGTSAGEKAASSGLRAAWG